MKINKKTKLADLLKKDPKMTVGDLFKSRKKGSKKSAGRDAEVQDDRLSELKEEAFSKEMEGATGLGKIRAAGRGVDKMRELEHEYKTARTGIKSRYGGIAKAFGADPKTSAMLDRLFGKKVDDKELAKLREKFNLDEKGKPKKEEKKDKDAEKRQAVQKDLIDKIDKIFDIVKEIRSVVEGVANKLRASPSKEVPTTKKGMRKLEKESGLKYSKETGRYHDVKTKKMVGFETARQKMNISPSALKVSGVTGAAALAGVGGAAAPTASKTMEGKADTFAKEGPKPATEEELKEVGKDVTEVSDFAKDIKDFFSPKKFYALVGGAIGAAIPVLIEAGKWLWSNLISPGVDFAVNIAKQIGQWLAGIEIPEFKIPLVGSIGPFKPFGFLAGVKPAPTETTAAPEGAPAPAASTPPQPPPGAGAAPPKPEGGGAGSAAAGGGGATGGGATGGGGGGSGGGGATGGGAPSAPTATPEGSNMPGGSPPAKKSGGGGSIPSGGYLGAAAEFIAKQEGLPKGGKAMWDPPGQNNLVSIGYGHQIQEHEYKQGFIQAGNDQVKIVGDRGIDTVMTKDQAKSLLAADLPKYEERAKKPLGEAWGKLDDEQKAALISYAYNTGSTGSLVKQGLKEAALTGNDEAGGEIISEKGVRTAGGKPFPALIKRRKLEGDLYAEGESSGKPAGGGAEGGGGTAVASASPPTPPAAPAAAAPAAAAPTAVAAVTPPPAAPTASPVTPAAPSAPTASPVETPPTYAQAVAANTTDVTVAKEEASSPASAPAPTLTAAATPQPSGAKPQNPDNSVKASARLVEDTFTRALAKDFSHPSAFTTVVMV